MANKYTLTEEDKALFRKAVKQLGSEALPMKTIDGANGATVKRSFSLKSNAVERVPMSLEKQNQETALSDYLKEEVDGDTILMFGERNFLRRQLSFLREGKIRWQARIDLHGLKQEIAKEHLIHFILQQHQWGSRCLLVIHGKGGQEGNRPVLKNLVNRWLPQFSQVCAFHSATSRDGGSGALYVWLKKHP